MISNKGASGMQDNIYSRTGGRICYGIDIPVNLICIYNY